MLNYELFPAHAGVILSELDVTRVRITFPRTCGGDPLFRVEQLNVQSFSPHMRG